MTLQDKKWPKDGFYPPTSDLVEGLFIPALEESTEYDRITGDFSSAILSLLTSGLKDFIERDGKIRLIPGAELQEQDVEAINKGYSDDLVKDSIDWDKVKQGMREEALEALAWLISNDHLEVRVGINNSGKWHEKIAIFRDSEGNTISTMGSPNESFRAFKRNTESLQLQRSWEDEKKVDRHVSHFENTWNNQNLPENQSVMDFTDALEEDMIEYIPQSEPDWEELSEHSSKTDGEHHFVAEEPREYQKEAIEKIKQNNNNLLIEHPTGTGKTWTALFTIKEIAEEDDIVLISAPKKSILNQWIGETEGENLSYFFPNCTKIRCQGGENWRERLYNHLNSDRDSPLFLVSTMHPSTLKSVLDLIRKHGEMQNLLFIADEVHNIGSKGRREALKEYKPGKARIGLSATLERNDEGDDFIWEYFGEKKDKISFDDAVNRYDVLSDYKLHVHEVALTQDELERYRELTQKITNMYHSLKRYKSQPMSEISDENENLSGLLSQRAAVLKQAEQKKEEALKILQNNEYDKTLIFCHVTDQMMDIQNYFLENTTETDYDNYYYEQDSNIQRDILGDFARGKTDVLLSMDCLNEGVDVPSCDSAIIISSSTSRREMVQRRGRVLRKAEEKNYANIHEFIVYPAPKDKIVNGKVSLTESDISLIQKEVERIKVMNEQAMNKESNVVQIYDVEKVLNMVES